MLPNIPFIPTFNMQILSNFLYNVGKCKACNERKTIQRAAEDLQWVRMWPADRQFDMAALQEVKKRVTKVSRGEKQICFQSKFV